VTSHRRWPKIALACVLSLAGVSACIALLADRVTVTELQPEQVRFSFGEVADHIGADGLGDSVPGPAAGMSRARCTSSTARAGIGHRSRLGIGLPAASQRVVRLATVSHSVCPPRRARRGHDPDLGVNGEREAGQDTATVAAVCWYDLPRARRDERLGGPTSSVSRTRPG
jgi:hypothetical protein